MSHDAFEENTHLRAQVTAVLAEREPVLVIRHGSFLYGMEDAESDIDICVVCLPSERDILMANVDFSYDNNPRSVKLKPGQCDIKVMSLMKYLGLLARFDATALEMLFGSDREDAVLLRSDLWATIRENSGDLIATNDKSALSVVRGNLGSLMPDRARCIARIEALADILGTAAPETPVVDISEIAGRPAGTSVMLEIERRLLDLLQPTERCLETVRTCFKKERPKRITAPSLGDFPGPHVAHAVRLMRQITEIATHGNLQFPRSDATELRLVKAQAMSDADLKAMVEAAFDDAIIHDWKALPFPESRNEALAENLIMEAYRKVILATSRAPGASS